MRMLNESFKQKFKEEFKPIIDFVKNNKDDIFLGIRSDYINLYVDGGSFFKLTYKGEKKGCTGYIDEKYFKECEDLKPEILEKINGKKIEDIYDWIDIFDSLKETVRKYQRKEIQELTRKKREKILQQKLVHEFNDNSEYFAYDIEYEIEGANEYVYDSNHKEVKSKRPKTPGRADIMLISKPVNNKITIYFMEVKEGTGAFGGVSEKDQTFGSGIAGHLKNNVEVINLARKNLYYESKYRKEKYPNKDVKIDIRGNLLAEVKYIMSFYKDFGLIENTKFKNINYENITLKDNEEAIEMVFFLGNYQGKEIGSFENYLGIKCDPKAEARYSIKKLLDNKMRNTLDLDFIKSKEMIDFKYVKEEKDCDDNNFNLDIDNYKEVKKEEFLN